MSNSSQSSALENAWAPRRRAGSLSARPPTRALAIVVLLTRLAVPAQALDGLEPNQIQQQAASPEVRITEVKALPVLKDKGRTEVEIRWIAQVPRSTLLAGFDVLLEVRYSDGSRGGARNQQLKSTARSILLSLATHPRPNSTAVLRDFKASVNVRFRTASSVAVINEVVASQSDKVRGLSGSPSGREPEVVVTARLVTRGCSNGNRCVVVQWAAAVPRKITITEFTARVDAMQKDGTKTTDSRTVGGRDRQARLQAGAANIEVSSIKVSLVASFFLFDSNTVVREGTFSIDSVKG